jgi:hypothetical protein
MKRLAAATQPTLMSIELPDIQGSHCRLHNKIQCWRNTKNFQFRIYLFQFPTQVLSTKTGNLKTCINCRILFIFEREERMIMYKWLWSYALSLSAFSHIRGVLFQYHEEHQYPIRGHGRSCRAGPLSCARSFTESPHHLDYGYYKLRSLIVYHSENLQGFILFQFYAFSIYAAIRRKATPAYNGSHLYSKL